MLIASNSNRRARITAICGVLVLLLGACSGGSSGGSANVAAQRVVYLADADVLDRSELYVVDRSRPRLAQRLNGDLAIGGEVSRYELVNGGRQVVYQADQRADGVNELFIVSLDRPGVVQQLNGNLVAGGDVRSDWQVRPDGLQVLYRADQDSNGRNELYTVNVAAPRVSTRVSGPQPSSADVVPNGFTYSPDGARIAYLSDERNSGINELLTVELSNPGVSVLLSPPMAAGGNVIAPVLEFSADGSTIYYRADQDVDEQFELYRVAINAPGSATRVNESLAPNGDVAEGLAPVNNDAVIYSAVNQLEGLNPVVGLNLFVASVGQPTRRLNTNLARGGIGAAIGLTADRSRVLYTAAQSSVDRVELLSVTLSTPRSFTTLSANTGNVLWPVIDRTQQRVLFKSDSASAGQYELYVVNVDDPASRQRVSRSPLGSALVTNDYDFSVDERDIGYLADHAIDGAPELYLVPLAFPGSATRLNGELIAGGQVYSFKFAY